MIVIDELNDHVKLLDMNDENDENRYGVSTIFITKLTYLFFITIGDKASTNIPLSKIYRLIKISRLACLYKPMYLELEDYPPYSDKSLSFLRYTLTET